MGKAKKNKRSVKKKWIHLTVNIALLLGSIVISLGLGELILRSRWKGLESADLYNLTVKDPEIGYRFSPNRSKEIVGQMNDYRITIDINRNGYRSHHDQVDKPEGFKRIFLFGDSEVFGLGVSSDNTLDVQLESCINKEWGGQAEVFNFSMPATGTLAHEKILELDALKFKPDCVVFLVTVSNDISDNVKYANAKAERITSQESHLKSVQKKSRKMTSPETPGLYLKAFAKWKLKPLFMRSEWMRKMIFSFYKPSKLELPILVQEWYTDKWLPEGWLLMKEAFKRIHDRCVKEKIGMLVAVIPSRVQFHSGYKAMMRAMTPDEILVNLDKDPRKPQRMIQAFCESERIPYAELLDHFTNLSREGVQLKHPNDGHLNARGTSEIAFLLTEPVQKLLQDI